MFLRPRIDTVEANKQYEENKKYHETNDRNNDRNNDRKKIKIYNDTEYEIVIDNEIKENKKIKKVYTQSHKFKLLFLLIIFTVFMFQDNIFMVGLLTTYGLLDTFMEFFEPHLEIDFEIIERYASRYIFVITFTSSYFCFDILFIYSLIVATFMFVNTNEILNKF
jgi:hypothetical protein